VDSVFAPTTKPQEGVVKAMNLAFYGLFLSLFGLAFVTSWNVHVLALSAVAVALYASITWFVAELGRVQEQQQPRVPQGDDKSAKKAVKAEPSQTGASAVSSQTKATATGVDNDTLATGGLRER